jgi:16S rRNA (uracil1498-N3)-methyltransferase
VNLILLEPGEIDAEARAVVDGIRAAHVREVLKAGPGQQVRVGMVDGPHGVGTVVSVSDASVTLQCGFSSVTPERPRVDLLLALPRPKVMRRLWAQLAALGVGRIMLTNAERVERNYFDTHLLAPGGYRPLLIEGLQQARDTRVPIVSVHRQLRVFVEDGLDEDCPSALRLIADPAAQQSPRAAVGDRYGGRVLLAIGPEGGWNDFERELFAAHGFRQVGMGSRTLRTDTAGIALLALVHAALA